jgi:hypothetical protein
MDHKAVSVALLVLLARLVLMAIIFRMALTLITLVRPVVVVVV